MKKQSIETILHKKKDDQIKVLDTEPIYRAEKMEGGNTMGYETCPYCGANLDSGEKCDCQKEVQEKSPATDQSKQDISK